VLFQKRCNDRVLAGHDAACRCHSTGELSAALINYYWYVKFYSDGVRLAFHKDLESCCFHELFYFHPHHIHPDKTWELMTNGDVSQ
jgi:hypothetical protein